jgi:L-malate glycosyltransferase
MRRIRILHVISSLEMGGAQAVLLNVIRALPSDTYQQYVVYFHHGPYVEYVQKLGVPVYQVGGILCSYDPFFWWRMLRMIRAIKPDVIHASLWSAGFVCRIMNVLHGIPVVTAVHAVFKHHGWLRCLLDRLTVSAADRFIAVSDEIASSVKLWLPNQVVHVVANGIDVEHIHMIQNAHEPYAIPTLLPEHFVIGSVGRFVSVKRYDLLLHLFAQLSRHYAQVRLLLIGVGPLEHELRAQALQLDIADKVVFIIGQSALRLYPHMDCFVQTSLYEGLSIALLEAMATGVVCITTGHDGQHAIIQHGINGYVVRPDNTQQMIDYIEQLILNPAGYKSVSFQAARTVREGYSIQAMRRGYETGLTVAGKNSREK